LLSGQSVKAEPKAQHNLTEELEGLEPEAEDAASDTNAVLPAETQKELQLTPQQIAMEKILI